MEVMEEVCMRVNYRVVSDCWRSSDDGTSFITQLNGDIFEINEEMTRTESQVGHLSATIIHLEDAIEAGADMEELFDGHCLETSDYTRDFYDFEENEVKEEFLGEFSHSGDNDILIINHVCLNKEGRGKGIGMKTLKDIELIFGKSKLIIMRPCPLQYGHLSVFQGYFSKMDFDGLPLGDKKKHTQKLIKIYKKLGYQLDKTSGLVFKNT
jgi:hypothetical protein